MRIVLGTTAFGALPWLVPISKAAGAQMVIFSIAAVTVIGAFLYRPRRLTVVAGKDDIAIIDEDGRGTIHFSPSEVEHIGLAQSGHILSHPIHWLHLSSGSSYRSLGPLFLSENPPLQLQAELDSLLSALKPSQETHDDCAASQDEGEQGTGARHRWCSAGHAARSDPPNKQ